MNQYDALKILGLCGQVTQEIIKQAYKKACSKFHPDRNPAGLEIMKMVNIAYEVLKNYDGQAQVPEESAHYGEDVAKALNKIGGLDLVIEICSAWVWVSGDTQKHKTILKEAGFKWASKKLCWYFRPEDEKCRRSKGYSSMGEIRAKYGSVSFKNKQDRLTC